MSFFARLTPREQWLVGLAGALVLVFGLWTYGWQPTAVARAAQQERIAQYLSLISLARQTPQAAGVPAATCRDAGALGPRITRSAEAAGIPLTRLDPDGARLRITVPDADYAGSMRWIAGLEAGTCTRVVAVEMVRLAAPGQISLRMTLEDVQ